MTTRAGLDTVTLDFAGFLFSAGYTIAGTIIGGAFLTFVLFAIKEWVVPYPDISGRWYLELKVTDTKYNPYYGMILWYEVILCRESNQIYGTAEKYFEICQPRPLHEPLQQSRHYVGGCFKIFNSIPPHKNLPLYRSYSGKNRTRSTVQGVLEKGYISKDKIRLHFLENGYLRDSTSFFEFRFGKKYNCWIKDKESMVGFFSSTVAENSGTARLMRKKPCL
jgi:hypothetical protein